VDFETTSISNQLPKQALDRGDNFAA